MKLQEIKTGDVAHCHRRGFLPFAIRTFTGSRYSHSAIFIWFNGELCIADSQKDGFNIRKYDNWMSDYGYSFTITRPLDDRIQIEERILSLVGTTSYDFESLIFRQPKKIITTILNRFRKNDKEPWKYRGEKENDRMYCSESVAYCLGLPESYQMSPKDLWDYCSKRQFIFGTSIEIEL